MVSGSTLFDLHSLKEENNRKAGAVRLRNMWWKFNLANLGNVANKPNTLHHFSSGKMEKY
jgi:nitrogen fixation protein